jgi:hypothetical protein
LRFNLSKNIHPSSYSPIFWGNGNYKGVKIVHKIQKKKTSVTSFILICSWMFLLTDFWVIILFV